MKTEDAFKAAQQLFELDAERVRCPYPAFEALRNEAPVAWFDELEAFVVTSYDLIVEVLRQPETFSSRSATGPKTDREMMKLVVDYAGADADFAALAGRVMGSTSGPVLLQADPPDHPRQRALVNRAFSPAAIRRMEPDIRALADELIDQFAARGQVELVAEFAGPLPMAVIARALGVALDRMDDFIRWSKASVSGIGKLTFEKDELAVILTARAELGEYLLSVVAERDADPKDDLISQIVTAEIDGERLTHAEVVNMAVQFLLAGNHTTAELIAMAALRLATEPALADRLRGDAGLIPAFVEEALRVEPPINGTYRVALEDYELGGTTIPAGSAVWMVYASGNRDPEHFAEPDRFHCPQPSRTPHLTFGFGAHFCLGAALARAEAHIAFQALLERCHDIRLAVDPDDVDYDSSFFLHGLRALPLTFTPKTTNVEGFSSP